MKKGKGIYLYDIDGNASNCAVALEVLKIFEEDEMREMVILCKESIEEKINRS